MNKDHIVFVKHIRDTILDIENFVVGIEQDLFYRDQKTQYAVLKALENIGEATKNLPDDFKKKYSDVMWRAISDARNVFIHQYFDVDLSQVWTIIKEDLPVLKNQIQKILQDVGQD